MSWHPILSRQQSSSQFFCFFSKTTGYFNVPMLARNATVYLLVMLQQGQSGRMYMSILRRGGRSISGSDSGDPSSPMTVPPPSVVMNPFSSSCLLNGLPLDSRDIYVQHVIIIIRDDDRVSHLYLIVR